MKKKAKKKTRKAPARKPAKRTAKRTAKKKATKKRSNHGPGCRRRSNPKRVVIGAEAVAVVYRGGQGKPRDSEWTHEIETPAEVIGNRDGSITIRSKRGLRLWDYYDYEG